MYIINKVITILKLMNKTEISSTEDRVNTCKLILLNPEKCTAKSF